MRPAEKNKALTCIIGGGASGLAAACVLTQAGLPFVLLEKESRPGRKLLATAPVADDHSHPRPAELVDAKSPLGDCCQAGDCCACMHHCFTALVGSTLGNVSVLYRQTAEPFLSVHASAALTNLFRPPIG